VATAAAPPAPTAEEAAAEAEAAAAEAEAAAAADHGDRIAGLNFSHENGATPAGPSFTTGISQVKVFTLRGEPRSVNRVREDRTHGVKGGWGNGPAQAPRP
jgi:hypothetical protein